MFFLLAFIDLIASQNLYDTDGLILHGALSFQSSFLLSLTLQLSSAFAMKPSSEGTSVCEEPLLAPQGLAPVVRDGVQTAPGSTSSEYISSFR
jgi:hypothetical protein